MASPERQTILVTGGAGHVGSHVIEVLTQDPTNRVISLDNYFNGTPDNHVPGAEYREGHTKEIFDLVPEAPDVIYHLGEYARIQPSFEEPDKVFDMNRVGTLAVATFARDRKAKLIYAASSTKFAAEGDGRMQNPYSLSKAENVDMINGFGRWFPGFKYAIVYFYNAFGPREKGQGKYATAIEKFLLQRIAGEPITIVEPGTQRRSFTYVGDLAKGMIDVAKKGQGDGYSLNNEKSYSIKEIAEAIGGPIRMIKGYPGRSGTGDIPEKARAELGWHTTVDVLDYIKERLQAAGIDD